MVVKLKHIILLLSLMFDFATGVKAQNALCRHYGMADGMLNLQSRKVIEMPDGRILTQLEGMFCVFDGERFRNLEYDRNKIINISSFLNTDYYFGNDSLLWVKDNTHLFAINAATYEFVDIHKLLENTGVKADINNFFVDHLGNAIFETEDHWIYVYDWKQPAIKLTQLKERNVEDKVVQLTDVVRMGNNYYLFVSNGKMLQVNAQGKGSPNAKQFISGPKEHLLKALRWNDRKIIIRDADGLVAYDINTGNKTRLINDGNVFDFKKTKLLNPAKMCVSTHGTVYLFDENLQIQDSIIALTDEANGERNNDNLQGATIDRQNGIWVATFNNGIFYKPNVKVLLNFAELNHGEDIVLRLFFKDNKRLRNNNVQVSAIYTDKQGQTWITTRNDGIVIVEPGGNITWLHYSDVPGLWGAVPFVRQIDKNRYLTCYRLNRLAVLFKNEKTLVTLTDKYPELLHFRNMVAITEITGGFLIGTQNGFFALERKRLKPNLERFSILNDNPYSDKCNCLLTDQDNIIWIGSQNGLFRLDEARQQLVRYSTKEGMPNNCVQSMVRDKNGNLWIATMGGICKMINENNDTRFITIPDNRTKETYKFSERMAFCIGDSLFFGTDKGIISLCPDDVNLPHDSQLPRLMSFMANDSTVVFCHHEPNNVEITLKYYENYVNMDISTLNYAYPQNTLYRYRIEEAGEDWIIPEVSNGKLSISFSALNPGMHTLVVQAAMQGQDWGPELKVAVRVLPPWWRTWWAYTAYLLLFLAVVAAIAYLYIKSQKDKLAIEQKEARIRQLLEQIKIKSQIPDNIELENSDEIKVSKEDEQFLQKAMECVEKNIENPDYGVEAFSRDMAMERTTLYRHLQSAIGKPPKEFIRTVRLKKAAELLRAGNHNVGEVADMVGFSNRKSFAKFFKESFGVLPSKYSS